MLEIRLLGTFTVSRHGLPLDLPKSRQARALLAYLISAGKSLSREHLCEMLWDTAGDPKAALRWSLTKLRSLVDEPGLTRIRAEGDRIAFNGEGTLSDTGRLESAVAGLNDPAGPTTRENRVWMAREAVALSGGSFLEGLELSECLAFQSWRLAQREKYRALAEKAHAALAALLEPEPGQALPAAQAWVVAMPESEGAHMAVMKSFLGLGRTAEALEQYRRFDALRKREGGSPGPAMEALRRSVPAKNAQPPRGYAPGPVPADGPSAESRALPPMVGREGELRRLLDHAGSGPSGPAAGGLLLIRGEPGMGKTRLLTSCMRSLEGKGYRVSYGASHRSESNRVYGPWRDALAGDPILDLFAGSRDAVVETGSDPNGFFERFAAALAELAIPGRQVFLFDDIQWMDAASFALLSYCLRRRVPAAFLAAARDRDLEDGPVRAFRTGLLRESMMEEIRLEALSSDDLRKLLAGTLDDSGREAVIRKSAGNPLFALELAKTGGEAGGSLESVIDSQMEKLSAPAQTLLPWLAALDRNLHLDLLARVCGTSPAQLVACVGDLEKAGMIVASDGGSSMGSDSGTAGAPEFAFRHELFRQAAYTRISAPRLRLIHRHIASVMREFFGDMEIAERARHAYLGEDWDGAVRDYAAAAERAFFMFANQETVELSKRAFEAAGKSTGDTLALRLGILRNLMSAEQVLGLAGDYVSIARGMVREAQAHPDKQLLTFALACLAGSFYMIGQWKEMGEAATRSVAMQAEAPTIEKAEYLADLASCFLMTDQDFPKAEGMVREASGICRLLNVRQYHVMVCEFMMARHAGDLNGLQRIWKELLGLCLERKDFWGICYSGMIISTDLLLEDCPSEALEVLHRIREWHARIPEGGEKAYYGVLDAFARRNLGESGLEKACEDGLEALRKADAKTYFAYASLFWCDLERGSRPDAVKAVLKEALDKMERLPRPTETALVRVKWARFEQESGNTDGARALIQPILPDLAVPKKMAKRAVDAVFRTAMELGLEIPTPGQTRVTTPGS
ncbi:MAG: hypothetical protein JWP91_163 [Fibrobacteres bacterium]|nr:hypothetical protein [Fibrobacterota bacterium]